MYVPSRLSPYLIENEQVLKEWSSKEWDYIYATQFRVFFIKDGTFNKRIIEASYNHISSIEFIRVRSLDRLISAIVCFILSFFTYSYFRNRIYNLWVYFLILNVVIALLGIALLIMFMIGVQNFIIHIAGRKPITVSKELTELIKFVREKVR